MDHSSVSQFLKSGVALKGPIALILAEDDVELDSTVAHHLDHGFRHVLVLTGEAAPAADAKPAVHRIAHPVLAEDALVAAVNQLIPAVQGEWIYAGFNAEYLFYPFAETRSIGELLAFHAEERRDAMLTTVIDLYADDLARFPDAVSRAHAHLDSAGYYALARKDEAAGWAARDRQLDLYGGLRWRFEEHVPWTRRRIDRTALFRSRPGLRMRADFTLSEEEMNTYACPWHNNLTAAVCSFRTAKALRSNPDSRAAIHSFRWGKSVAFRWQAQQLMDLGFMEPGQWF
jgi:hypothetical protein